MPSASSTGSRPEALIPSASISPSITVWILGAAGYLPRVKPSTKGEGHERRFFYGSVWAVCIAQPVLWLLWPVLPAGFT
jgi:hypothetical protein